MGKSRGGEWGNGGLGISNIMYFACQQAIAALPPIHIKGYRLACRGLSFLPLSFSSFFSHLSLPTRLSFVLIILHKKLIISISVSFFFCCCLSCSPSLVDKFFVIFGVRRFYLVLKLNTICFRYCCCFSSCHTFSY